MAHLLSVATRNPTIVFVVLFFWSLFGSIVLGIYAYHRKWMRIALAALIGGIGGVLGTFALAFLGPPFNAGLIYEHGVRGEGVIVARERTDEFRNYNTIEELDVEIRTADGQTIRTTFRTDAFNVWPVANRVRYPGVGVPFTVHYLPNHPEDFVIIANDDSPFARSLR